MEEACPKKAQNTKHEFQLHYSNIHNPHLRYNVSSPTVNQQERKISVRSMQKIQKIDSNCIITLLTIHTCITRPTHRLLINSDKRCTSKPCNNTKHQFQLYYSIIHNTYLHYKANSLAINQQ